MNGASSEIKTNSIVQPRILRSPTHTLLVVLWATSSPWLSDPSSSWAARPIFTSFVEASLPAVSPKADGGEVDQGGRAGCVVVCSRAGPRVVPVRHHHDRIVGLAECDRRQILQPNGTTARELLRPGVRARGEAVRGELLAEPLRRADR